MDQLDSIGLGINLGRKGYYGLEVQSKNLLELHKQPAQHQMTVMDQATIFLS